ncbi:hypothetical protein DL96DRAFT_1575840 [Flagelloscypha sp. PMI_526]|nr:hypothetical protein DL96DRAFT_1575840 [Flagelloscypha sp. PMI_526]
MSDIPVPVVALLSRALHRVRTTPPRSIASPATQPRRAAVALLIRVVPSKYSRNIEPPAQTPTLSDFFELDWVKDPHAVPEILFLHRHHDESSRCPCCIPGGRQEPDDEGGLYTAMRQTWEETGIDLAEKNTTLHWIPIETLVSPIHPPKWSTVSPRHSAVLKVLVQVLVGTMQFPAIRSETSLTGRPYPTRLKLWGLSLGMTLDLMAYMTPQIPASEKPRRQDSPLSPVLQLPYQEGGSHRLMEIASPRLASVFPKFSYPDVNFWIWQVHGTHFCTM